MSRACITIAMNRTCPKGVEMSEIHDWLDRHGLIQLVDIFEREQIDLAAVPTLSEADLKDLGLPVGLRGKLRAAIQALRDAAQLSGTSPQPEVLSSRNAERRQLTVLFCDLVGSTALTHEIDPEPLRELMQAYQQSCSAVIDKYDGHVAQYLGDGLMVYFGWPKAHEDDAERAIRASLEIVDAVKKVLLAPEPLRVRIGIATGPVVVGETGAGDASIPKVAVGETPNLAARLQALSEPDQIVISLTTHRLLGAAFEFADLGVKDLKGIIEPVRAFRVLRAARTEGRFDAAHGANLISLVGREEEIDLFMRRWEQAKSGEGQMVLIGGEPGIGKSRITRALRERVAGEPHVRLRYQCSPFHTNSALHPIIEHFERAAAFIRDEAVEQKLDKLETLLRDGGADIPSTAPLIATMLSLSAERYPALNLSPQKC